MDQVSAEPPSLRGAVRKRQPALLSPSGPGHCLIQHVRPDQQNHGAHLQDHEPGPGAGEDHGDLRALRVSVAARDSGVPAALHRRQWLLRVRPVPGPGAAGPPAAVLRVYGSAHDGSDSDPAAPDPAAHDAAGLPADPAARQRQQPGVRPPPVPAEEHAGGETPNSDPSPD